MPTRRDAAHEELAPTPLRVHVPIGIYRTTPDGRIIDANDALVRILGFPSREALLEAKASSLYVEPGAREAFRERLEREGVVENFELEARRADGTTVWVRNSAALVRDPEGRILWFEGVVEDITERKRTEAALARRLEFERTLAIFSSRFAGALDVDDTIRKGLGDLARLSGAGRAYLFLIRADEELMDNTHEWCAPHVQPQAHDLQALPVAAFPWWMERLRLGQAVHVMDVASLPPEAAAERAILEPQGIKSVLAFPVRVGGRLAGFIGFDNVERAAAWREEDLHLLHVASGIIGSVLERHHAQAALRHSERRFRLLVDQSPLSVQMVSPSGRILRVNRAWERLWGVTVEALGDYNVFEDRQLEERGIMPYIRRALAGEPSATPPVLYRPLKGENMGKDIWVRAVIYPVIGDGDDVREIVIIQEDITEILRQQAELEASRHQLAVSEKLSALGALVSGVAHEIRTPLTYVSNNVVLLRRAAERARESGQTPEDLAKEVGVHASAVEEGVDRIAELVNDLRSYAKLRGGKRTVADLRDVVQGAVDLFRATHRGTVEVAAKLDATGPVEVDREQVQQVVLNLLNNAADAMHNRGVVRVQTRRTRAGFEFVVEDEGPGLAPEAEQHMFEPFFTTKPEGTGLGLSISKRLVESHGGSLRHERPDGGGARFVAHFPASVAAKL